MSIINIDSYRCTKFNFSHERLATGKFDINNPCTFCTNRKAKYKEGSAFFYSEFGRWEFPFVAEATCKNFSLIHVPTSKLITPVELKTAQEMHKHYNRVSKIGKKYDNHWFAFDPNEVGSFQGIHLNVGDVVYPNGLSSVEFYREFCSFRSDIFEIVMEIKNMGNSLKREFGGLNQNFINVLNQQERSFKECLLQIEKLEDSRDNFNLSTISKWASNNIGGNLAYDVLKMSIGTIRKLVFGL
jgi:hypothetical protein